MLYRSEILKGCDSVSVINQSFWESLNIALCTLWDYFGIRMLSVFHFYTHIMTGKLLFDLSGSLSVISHFLPVLLQCICSVNDREGQIELSGLVLCARTKDKVTFLLKIQHSISSAGRLETSVQYYKSGLERTGHWMETFRVNPDFRNCIFFLHNV